MTELLQTVLSRAFFVLLFSFANITACGFALYHHYKLNYYYFHFLIKKIFDTTQLLIITHTRH